MGSNMNVTMVWAWMLWSSYGVEHDCYYGLGMDALVIVWAVLIECSRTQFWSALENGFGMLLVRS